MLHPVGSQSPAVYWRRRLVLLALVVILIVISILVLRPSSGKGQGLAASTTSPAPTARVTTTPPKTASSPAASSPAASHPAASGPASSPTGHSTAAGSAAASKASSTTAAPPKTCALSQLKIAAAVGQSTYAVGAEPIVMVQVTDAGPLPCVQNLADSQIELRVYNGASRVWGSHDCEIQPGTDNRTLAVNQPVRVSVTWSGLTSEPGCAGTRQRVGAGTYTLYAYVGGQVGTAAQFSIS